MITSVSCVGTVSVGRSCVNARTSSPVKTRHSHIVYRPSRCSNNSCICITFSVSAGGEFVDENLWLTRAVTLAAEN